MRCTPANKEENLARGGGEDARGGGALGAGDLPAFTVCRGIIFAGRGRSGLFNLGGGGARATTGIDWRRCEGKEGGAGVSVFERRAAGVNHNTCACWTRMGRIWESGRCIFRMIRSITRILF